MKRSVLVQIIAAIAGPALLVGAVYFATNNGLVRRANADTYIAKFDSDNSPTLSGGEGTILDHRGITWEYSGASDYASGHVSLGNGGFFGTSSVSPYGLKGITGVTAKFDANSNAELWLLTSIDGVEWNEYKPLENNVESHGADNWQYVRFYNYSSDESAIDIESVTITYSCESISASDDVDYAVVDNVLGMTNVTASSETTNVRPGSTRALKFAKTKTGTSEIIGFGKDGDGNPKRLTIGDVAYSKVSFDYKGVVNYKLTMSLWDTTIYDSQKQTYGKVVGTQMDTDRTGILTRTEIDGSDGWYHVECFVTALAPTIASKKYDAPVPLSTEFDGIKLNIGTGVIDNLRFTTKADSELGIFNGTYECSKNKQYWVKIAWCGSYHDVVYTFSDDTVAEQVYLEPSKFYIKGKGVVGSTTVYAQVTVGYNRVVKTITSEVISFV